MNSRKQFHRQIDELSGRLQQVNGLLSESDDLSMLDIDLLRKTTIDIYEAVNNLRLVKNEKATPTEPVYTEPAVAYTAPELPVVEEQKTKPVFTLEAEPEMPEPEAMIQEEIQPEIIQHTETPVVTDEPVNEIITTEVEMTEKSEPVKAEVSAPEEIPVEIPVLPQEKVTETVAEKTVHNEHHTDHNLVSKFNTSPIADLKKFITIGKKFEFINTLFKGNHEQYTYAIHHLNNIASGDEAFQYLNKLRNEQLWDEENTNYLELADLVRRRFL